MSNNLLLETIKIKDGLIMNIEWHNQRLNQTRKILFDINEKLKLEKFIKAPKKGLYRCRILYKESIQSIEYLPYIPKEIHRIKVIKSQINYPYKYNDRVALNQLKCKFYDDVIIEKNGLLSDTTIANIAFYTGKFWITPKAPLLQGTFREKLLSENFLIEKNIQKEEIKNFSHFALMNAMIGFQLQRNLTIRL